MMKKKKKKKKAAKKSGGRLLCTDVGPVRCVWGLAIFGLAEIFGRQVWCAGHVWATNVRSDGLLGCMGLAATDRRALEPKFSEGCCQAK
jgi:hypothetical protein